MPKPILYVKYNTLLKFMLKDKDYKSKLNYSNKTSNKLILNKSILFLQTQSC
jgi:hypothetical protein